MTLNQDPWVKVRTKHDLPADEVISCLQKEIRRGNEKNATMIAYEMMITSPELEAKMWERLVTISVEDIGMGNVLSPVVVNALYQQHLIFSKGEGDRLLFALQAVRFLCSCTKDRSTDEMINWYKYLVEQGKFMPEIPDYAIDMHTDRGQKMGRGVNYFLTVGAKIIPELSDRDTTYLKNLLEVHK